MLRNAAEMQSSSRVANKLAIYSEVISRGLERFRAFRIDFLARWTVMPSKKEIECLAYKLWEKAGQPKGRDQEFYLEAERELQRQGAGHEPEAASSCPPAS
jgi:hypothetical protein